MKIIRSVVELRETLDNLKGSLGFTPTMGALHEGHLSLVKKAKQENDFSIVSIFVNPTQFNEASDLQEYPRTEKEDAALLETVDNDFLFIPSVKEIYPNGTLATVDVDLEGLDLALEGAFRPGHFNGVVQVVHRLLDIVKPHKIYMGQKDFQQFTIIQKMITNLKMDVILRVCPIKRNSDGLALSSRNVRLTEDNLTKSVLLNRTLHFSKALLGHLCISEIEQICFDILNQPSDFKTEYFTIINGHSLQKIQDDPSDYKVALTAVWAGDVRLIDNLIISNIELNN